MAIEKDKLHYSRETLKAMNAKLDAGGEFVYYINNEFAKYLVKEQPKDHPVYPELKAFMKRVNDMGKSLALSSVKFMGRPALKVTLK